MSTAYPQFFPTPDLLMGQAGVETLRNIADGTIESANRLATLQIEAAQAAVTENSKQFRSFLQNTADTSAALSQWSVLFGASFQRFTQMTKYYIESAAQDMTDFNRWFGQGFSPFSLWNLSAAGGAAAAPKAAPSGERDRRVAAQLITFPERRASELAKAAAEAAAESARHATEVMEEGAQEVEEAAVAARPPEEEARPQEQVMAQPPSNRGKAEPGGPAKRGGSRKK
jgi:hypothetical protein